MISLELYKLLHLLGMMMVFVALGGVALHAATGASRQANPNRRTLAVLHGVGLVLMLVAGFGMLARLGGSMSGGWLWTKVAIWLVLGGSTVLPYKSRGLAGAMLGLLPFLGLLAAYMAIYKPF